MEKKKEVNVNEFQVDLIKKYPTIRLKVLNLKRHI